MGRGGGAGAGGARAGRTRVGILRLGTRMLSPAALMRATLMDEPLRATSEERLRSVRQLFDKGQQNQGRPVKVAVTPSGKIEVIDGRHRILVARERGIPIKVQVVRGSGA